MPDHASPSIADLNEQMDFLRSSMEIFDGGREHEAKRLAVVLRVLLYDHGGTSLLTQLGLKSQVKWLSVAFHLPAPSPMTALSPIRLGEGPATFVPYTETLLQGRSMRALDFDTWWSESVVRTRSQLEFSRRNLVLLLANRAGGAHIGRLTADERVVVSGSDSGWSFTGPEGPFELNIVPASVRSIATEVDLSIRQAIATGLVH